MVSKEDLDRCRKAYVELRTAQKKFLETEDFAPMELWIRRHSEFVLEIVRPLLEEDKNNRKVEIFDLVAEMKRRG